MWCFFPCQMPCSVHQSHDLLIFLLFPLRSINFNSSWKGVWSQHFPFFIVYGKHAGSLLRDTVMLRVCCWFKYKWTQKFHLNKDKIIMDHLISVDLYFVVHAKIAKVRVLGPSRGPVESCWSMIGLNRWPLLSSGRSKIFRDSSHAHNIAALQLFSSLSAHFPRFLACLAPV